MELLLSLGLGIGLSASCGFRVFVPLLVANVASLAGYLPLNPGFEWMGSWVAFGILLVATLTEIGAYYFPWLDNLLDAVALPVAFSAGTLLTTSLVSEVGPVMQWVLGLMVGGGSAGLVQAGTGLIRLGSTATTGGLGNPVVATVENIASLVFSVLALWLPLIVGTLAILLIIFLVRRLLRRRGRRPEASG
ncbi:MAG: DUF4126 domain-containing protein [Ferruginibacter sp.]|nr:DUF4126 domain-containing protein [Cytophagales bacterium]